MSKSYRIASPYLRMVLQAGGSLTTNLPRSLIVKIEDALASDYVSGELVNVIFETAAELGITSWISRFGNQLGVGSHGPPGFAALSAPNLLTALDVFAEYGDLRNSGSHAETHVQGDRLYYVVTDETDHPLAGPWLIESNFLVAQKLIESIMGHPLGTQSQFDFVCRRQPRHKAVESMLHAKCNYQQEQNCLSIPASWAAMPSPLADADSFRSNLAKSRELRMRLDRDRNDVAQMVSNHLRNHFDRCLSGVNTASEIPDLQKLADDAAMSRRTLIRKLASQNTSYRTILESMRLEFAQSLLRNTHLTAAEIAFKLGYCEAANFGRAFRRWTGTTPAAWRRSEFKRTATK